MRTTIAIDDDLLKRLKELAVQRGETMASMVNGLLRQSLARGGGRPGYRLELSGWDAEEQPGVDILDRDKLFDLMDGR